MLEMYMKGWEGFLVKDTTGEEFSKGKDSAECMFRTHCKWNTCKYLICLEHITWRT